MKTVYTGRRIKLEPRQYTQEERDAMKARAIAEAEAWEPPTEYTVPVYLEPGQAGYEEAPYVEVLNLL